MSIAAGLFGLSNRCTFDINSLSGTELMASGVIVQLFCLIQLLHVEALPWLRRSFCFLVLLAGSLASNLVDISAKVCGVTKEQV